MGTSGFAWFGGGSAFWFRGIPTCACATGARACEGSSGAPGCERSSGVWACVGARGAPACERSRGGSAGNRSGGVSACERSSGVWACVGSRGALVGGSASPAFVNRAEECVTIRAAASMVDSGVSGVGSEQFMVVRKAGDEALI